MVRIMGPRAEKRAIKISVDIAADQPRLSLDERAIKQMLLNLLSNAVKLNRQADRYSCGPASTVRPIT